MSGRVVKNTGQLPMVLVQNAVSAVKQVNHQLTEWDESLIRQLVHTVKVISADRILVYLTEGTEIPWQI